jgi:hypothetical protein
MKLPNTTHGPVTLSKIDYAPSLSEETVAFAAVVDIAGKSCRVHNEGHGGANFVSDSAVYALIASYAATLPPEPSDYGEEPLTYDVDFLISTMIDSAVNAHERKSTLAKMVKAGYTHSIDIANGHQLYFFARDEADARLRLSNGKYAAFAETAKVTQIADPAVVRLAEAAKARKKMIAKGYTHIVTLTTGGNVYTKAATAEQALAGLRRNPQYSTKLAADAVAVSL